MINAYLTNRKNILVKGRQLGATTTTAAFIAHFILFQRDKNVLIIATKQETAKNMIRAIKTIFRHIPKWMLNLGKITVDNRNSLELANGSRVKAITTSSDAGRSEAASLLVIDEAAHIQNLDEIWQGASPTTSTGGSVIIMSTPNRNTEMLFINYMKMPETI